MEILKDLLQEHGVFEEINKIVKLPFPVDISPDKIDYMYLVKHGNRKLSLFSKTADIKNLCETISIMYSDKWNSLYKIFLQDIPYQYDYRRTTTETVKDNGTNGQEITDNSTDTVVKEVSAYNEPDFVGADKEERTLSNNSNHKQNNENVRERELTTEGTNSNIIGNYEKYIQYIEKNFIFDIIFNDVNSVLTLNVF